MFQFTPSDNGLWQAASITKEGYPYKKHSN
jgi:hypothetical protein